MKSKFIVFVTRTLARVVGALGPDVAPKNSFGPSADNTVPDDNVPRDPPSHVALFTNGGLNKPVWGLLRVEDVIR
jgi:hypothetical protein